MDHTQDQHLITFGDIEYPMLAVNETADTLAQFGIRRTRKRMMLQQGECFVKSAHVGFGGNLAKLHDRIIVYRIEISNRRVGELYLSHAALFVARSHFR